MIGLHLLCGFLTLCVTFALFAAGIFGGGDAKKMTAAAAVWIGFDLMFPYLLIAAAGGGLLTLLLLYARAYPWPGLAMRAPFIARLTNPKEGIPMASRSGRRRCSSTPRPRPGRRPSGPDAAAGKH